jgi:hypothetical protein
MKEDLAVTQRNKKLLTYLNRPPEATLDEWNAAWAR